MTDIDTLQAGPELDVLVAEKVMGLEVSREVHPFTYHNATLDKERGGIWSSRIPAYSTDIAAAWEVVGKLIYLGVSFCIIWQDGFYVYDGWRNYEDGISLAHATTAPLAICKAALKAIRS